MSFRPLKVAMMPDFRAGNPYQSMLATALEQVGVSVTFPSGYRRILPIWRAVSQASVDVLHLHWLSPYLKGRNTFWAAIYAAKFCFDLCLVRLNQVKIIWTIHNQISHEAQFPRIERFVQNFVGRLAAGLIVHSESARQTMIDTGLDFKAKPLRIIPHGHYAGSYSEPVPLRQARQTFGWDAEQIVFLYFGMVRPYKNLEGLIEAWRSLPMLAKRANLVIVGEATDPAYRQHIQKLAEGVPGLSLQLRHIPDREVHLYFSASNVVVLPFKKTLTSGSLLLAMSFGKPIVAPRLNIITEILRNADDLLYDCTSEEGLRTALELAASPATDLVSLSRRVTDSCVEFSWDRIALLTVSVYEG